MIILSFIEFLCVIFYPAPYVVQSQLEISGSQKALSGFTFQNEARAKVRWHSILLLMQLGLLGNKMRHFQMSLMNIVPIKRK